MHHVSSTNHPAYGTPPFEARPDAWSDGEGNVWLRALRFVGGGFRVKPGMTVGDNQQPTTNS